MRYWIGLFFVSIFVGYIYFGHQVSTIFGGDAGDLASAVLTKGIPHPPGYPLYTLLSIDAVHLIPWGSPAWKIAWMSSLPTFLAIILLYDCFFLLSRRAVASVVSACALACLYPVWLYGIVVEVFALNNFFIALLLNLSLRWWHSGQRRFAYATCFVFGLSLTHHHIILFLTPAIFYLFYKRRLRGAYVRVLAVFFFLLGLLPYSYVIISSWYTPAVNWMGQATPANFLTLVTRAGYGTFRSGAYISHDHILRLVDVWAFFDFLYTDIRIAGVILLLIGVVYMFVKNRNAFWAIFWGSASYIFFLYYASFPLVDNFLLATYERFIQPLYILFSFFILYGVIGVSTLILPRLAKEKTMVPVLISCVFVIFPLGLFFLNMPKMALLREDQTAENLGRDILASAQKNSIVLLSSDTPLFDTQYVYFAEPVWQDRMFIHFTKLYAGYYNDQLRRYYPTLSLVEEPESFLPFHQPSQRKIFEEFLDKNYEKFPIYSKSAFASENGVWVPWGMVFRYYRTKDVPSDEKIHQVNQELWKTMHDPTAGSLGQYKHLMLSDVLRIYSVAHQEIGYWYVRHGYSDDGIGHLETAASLTPKDVDTYSLLAQAYITKKRCDDAQKQLEKLLTINPESGQAYLLLTINHSVCFDDEQKAQTYRKKYEELTKTKETPLPEL